MIECGGYLVRHGRAFGRADFEGSGGSCTRQNTRVIAGAAADRRQQD
jgi:hypothetical protein